MVDLEKLLLHINQSDEYALILTLFYIKATVRIYAAIFFSACIYFWRTKRLIYSNFHSISY